MRPRTKLLGRVAIIFQEIKQRSQEIKNQQGGFYEHNSNRTLNQRNKSVHDQSAADRNAADRLATSSCSWWKFLNAATKPTPPGRYSCSVHALRIACNARLTATKPPRVSANSWLNNWSMFGSTLIDSMRHYTAWSKWNSKRWGVGLVVKHECLLTVVCLDTDDVWRPRE